MKKAVIKSVGRPKRQDKDNSTVSSNEKGTLPGEIRKTYVISTELVNKIDAISFWDRKSLKEVIKDALSTYIASWEKKNGLVKMPGQKD